MEDRKIATLWFVPKETNKSQCLNILLIKKTKETVELVVSEYQCIFGHRMSRLLLQMFQSHHKTQENLILELVEEDDIDIIPALFYIHSESLDTIFSDCPALILAKTAHFLQIDHLCHYIIQEASITLSYTLNLSQDIGMLRISVWDAITILHLLEDTYHLLNHINLQQWCER